MIIKTIIYVEANVVNIYAKFQLHPPYGFWEGSTKHHKPPQNTTNHPKAQLNHHTHPLNKYSDPNLGRKCCGLECEVQKGYDIVKFLTANIHW